MLSYQNLNFEIKLGEKKNNILPIGHIVQWSFIRLV